MINSINKFILIALAFFLLLISCQKDPENLESETNLCLVEVNGAFEDIELDQKPMFLAGEDEFGKSIAENLNYPAEARENGIQGTAVLHYEITKVGTVENIIAIEDPGGGIGDASVGAIEVGTEGVSFSPGILDGNPVRVKKEIKLEFSL
ncbi:energy transducer TonB [Saprospiraceae bacterium]|nr:energy transducer TonB [Saprospiraceae bacterium]